MPIFEKDGQRLMFAHIPKCGGTSIYSSFMEAGWEIKNLMPNRSPGSAFSILRERFGINTIERHGRRFRYPHSLQHAPHLLWQTWGPFDASFTIVREPKSRLLSALKYHYREMSDSRSFYDYAQAKFDEVSSRRFNYLKILDGHLIPQHFFVNRKTEIFRFEEDWPSQLANRFDINPPGHNNKAPVSKDVLSSDWQIAAHRLYKRDYKKFGY